MTRLYGKIALERGQIIAKLKGIENEKAQSKMLTHWALVGKNTEDSLSPFVSFIPKEGGFHKKLFDNLSQYKNKEKKNRNITLYYFTSLTFRALEKLCWKEHKNTFMAEIKKEIDKEYIPQYKEQWRNDVDFYKLIRFYKKVLSSEYAQKNLDLEYFSEGLDEIQKTDFSSLEEFESALETICYTTVPLYFSEEEFLKFKEEYNIDVFEITTRSISKESKRKENTHATYWKNFWSDAEEKNYKNIRINPEMTVLYRDEIQGKSNRGKTNKGIENRFSAPRYTLATSITINPATQKTRLEFKKVEDIEKHILDFNKSFNKEFSGEWVYGIDRGLNELATLNIVKFAKEKNEFQKSQPEKFAKIPVYKLKDENEFLKKEDGSDWLNAKGEKRKIIDNISMVLEGGKEPCEKLFERDEVSSIDLTQAKLIKGYIILNGDQKTYLKLKELSAKRRIFELFSTPKIDVNALIKITKEKIHIYCNDGVREIYNWKDFEKKNQNHKNKIKKELNYYLGTPDKNNKFEDVETIEKINHLRDAITANMIGVIAYLQKEYRGYIALENMDIQKNEKKDIIVNGRFSDEETGNEIKMIDDHFSRSNQDISRRLEWSLFRKFANTGEVPPEIKESILLRDEFSVYQFGILKFVKIGGTSSNCPQCEEYSGKSGTDFICKFENNCTFSTKNNETLLEKNLNNADEVAAYNVAKNGYDGVCEKDEKKDRENEKTSFSQCFQWIK